MYKEGTEGVVREPITIEEDGSLICLGDIPENSVMYILKGERAALIDSARDAARTGVQDLNTEIKPVSYTHLTLPTIYSV